MFNTAPRVFIFVPSYNISYILFQFRIFLSWPHFLWHYVLIHWICSHIMVSCVWIHWSFSGQFGTLGEVCAKTTTNKSDNETHTIVINANVTDEAITLTNASLYPVDFSIPANKKFIPIQDVLLTALLYFHVNLWEYVHTHAVIRTWIWTICILIDACISWIWWPFTITGANCC